MIVAEAEEPSTLNPYVPGGTDRTVSTIGQSYWAGVQDIDGRTLELVPDLVTELPSVANGGVTVNEDLTMTIRYNIREAATWSDGTPISGDDFQFTLDTILDPDNPIVKTVYEDVVDSAAGDKTFEYTLAAPTTRYEMLFNVVIPKHAVEGSDFATEWNDKMWVSGGPFVFDKWEKGAFLRVVRNENYWKTDESGAELPFLNSVTFQFIPDTDSIVNAFQAREVDIIQPPATSETIARLQELEPDGATVEILAGPTWEHLNFQFGPGRLDRNPESVNDNINYRKAVAHAIDKNRIVEEILDGHVPPLDSFVSTFRPSLSQNSWLQYDYNPESAAAFVEAAKADTGKEEVTAVFSTTSNRDARVKLSELLVGMFEAVGITYRNELEDSQIFFGETLDNGRWDLGEWAYFGEPGIADLVKIFDVWDPQGAPTEGGTNYYRWGTEDSSIVDDSTARFGELLDEMKATVDEEALIPLINEAEKILADNVVLIPLYARLVTAAVWGDEVAGFKHNPQTGASHTWNIEDWRRLDL